MPSRSIFIGRIVLATGFLLGAWLATPVSAQENSVLKTVLEKGVNFDQQGMRRLRPPTLADGLSADQQKAAIEQVLPLKQGKPATFKDFTMTGLNAPYVMVIDEPRYAQGAPGHSIDLWFTVYGKLDKVATSAFLKTAFQPNKKDKMDTLKDADLAQRNIKVTTSPGAVESYVYGQFRVFPTDTRVVVGGTCHMMHTTTETSSVLAGVMDSRFDKDPTFGNQWQPVVAINAGQLQLGAGTIYHSAGGYTKITELVEPAGALLVEYHFVYEEPTGWFNGNDLLRPKLVGETPDDVRQFRNKVRFGK